MAKWLCLVLNKNEFFTAMLTMSTPPPSPMYSAPPSPMYSAPSSPVTPVYLAPSSAPSSPVLTFIKLKCVDDAIAQLLDAPGIDKYGTFLPLLRRISRVASSSPNKIDVAQVQNDVVTCMSCMTRDVGQLCDAELSAWYAALGRLNACE